jgi:hypothetical protein
VPAAAHRLQVYSAVVKGMPFAVDTPSLYSLSEWSACRCPPLPLSRIVCRVVSLSAHRTLLSSMQRRLRLWLAHPKQRVRLANHW